MGKLGKQIARFGSDLNHLEVFLARAALGAGPVHRHLLPGRTGRDAMIRSTR